MELTNLYNEWVEAYNRRSGGTPPIFVIRVSAKKAGKAVDVFYSFNTNAYDLKNFCGMSLMRFPIRVESSVFDIFFRPDREPRNVGNDHYVQFGIDGLKQVWAKAEEFGRVVQVIDY